MPRAQARTQGLNPQILRGLTDKEIAAIDSRAKIVGLSRNAWYLKAIRHILAQPVVRVKERVETDL